MSRFEKWCLGLTTAATAVTGTGLLLTKYLMQSDDPWAVINHPLQPWFLKIHILVAPTLVFAVGLIATRHIWPHFKAGLRAGLRSGTMTALVTVPMVLSGYFIQTMTEPGWLKGIAVTHIATGFLFTAAFIGHRVRVRWRQRAGRTAAVHPGGGRKCLQPEARICRRL